MECRRMAMAKNRLECIYTNSMLKHMTILQWGVLRHNKIHSHVLGFSLGTEIFWSLPANTDVGQRQSVCFGFKCPYTYEIHFLLKYTYISVSQSQFSYNHTYISMHASCFHQHTCVFLTLFPIAHIYNMYAYESYIHWVNVSGFYPEISMVLS